MAPAPFVRDAAVSRNFDVTRDAQGTHFDVRRVSAIRHFVGSAVAIGAGFFGLIAVVVAFVSLLGNRHGPDRYTLLAFLVAAAFLGLFYGAYRWGSARAVGLRVSVGSEGILTKGLLYRFRDITHLGFDNMMGDRSPDRGLGRAMAELGYRIYVTHGTKKVVLVPGLDENEARILHREMCEAAAASGHPFTDVTAPAT